MFNILLLCLAFYTVLAVNHQDVLPNGRIIGGHNTNILTFPYQVSVQYLNKHRCGGAIIARTWILTSATCIVEVEIDPAYFTVRVGTTYHELGGTVLNVSRLVTHIDYNVETEFDFDIGLIQLAEPIPLSKSAQIVALPNSENDAIEGRHANVTGWGTKTSGGTTASTILQVIEIPILVQRVCVDLYRELRLTVTERMLCAGLWEGGKDSCSGDGGGPLVSNSVLTGIVSWGVRCGKAERPGVYTNVGVLRDWITNITGI